MKVRRASTADRPVFGGARTRVGRVLGTFGRLSRRVPWLFVASGAGFVSFGFDVWRPLGFLIIGVMFALAELSGDTTR